MPAPRPRALAGPQAPGGPGGPGALHLRGGAGARAALTALARPPRSHDKGPEAEEGVELQEGECSRGARAAAPGRALGGQALGPPTVAPTLLWL